MFPEQDIPTPATTLAVIEMFASLARRGDPYDILEGGGVPHVPIQFVKVFQSDLLFRPVDAWQHLSQGSNPDTFSAAGRALDRIEAGEGIDERLGAAYQSRLLEENPEGLPILVVSGLIGLVLHRLKDIHPKVTAEKGRLSGHLSQFVVIQVHENGQNRHF